MYILFKNETKYTKKIYDDYCKFHTKSNWFSYILYSVFAIAVFLICLFYQIKSSNYILILIVLLLLIAFASWRYFYPIYTRKKVINSPSIKKQTTYSFCFFDKTVEISSIDNPNEITVIKYRQFYKIYNTKRYFYLYTDKTHSFILKKDCFTIGNQDDFSKFIKNKCWYKYKNSSN